MSAAFKLFSLDVFAAPQHCWRACQISCASVALAIAIQGAVHTLSLPPGLQGAMGSSIMAIECADGGKLAALVFSHSVNPKYDKPEFSLATRAFAGSSCVFHSLPGESRAHDVAGHPFLPRFFVGTEDGWIFVLDITGSRAAWRRVGRHPEKVIAFLRCSPDGDVIVASGNQLTAAWSASSGALLWQRPLNVTSMFFAKEKPRLFCGLFNGEIVELDPARGDTLATLITSSSKLSVAAASADGERLALVSSRGQLLLFDVERRMTAWSCLTSVVAKALFTPDGRHVICSEYDGQDLILLLREVESGKRCAVCDGLSGVGQIAAGPDGSFLTWLMEGPVLQWRIKSRGQTEELVPAGFTLSK